MNLINKVAIAAMPIVPKAIVGRVASRYIAGETIEDAFNEAKNLNDEGCMVTIDILGEHSANEDAARRACSTYMEIIDGIQSKDLDANISLKPTHLGLKLGYEFCRDQVDAVMQGVTKVDNFLRIDMEDYTCTDDTFGLYFDMRERYEGVGVVIQAYLRRTIRDIDRLIASKANLRLCKGIYNEPRAEAHKNRQVIINNYALLLERLLREGCYVGIATHCEETIWHAERILDELALSPDKYEFQMLLGVEPGLRKILIDRGHRLRVYIPFGNEWYQYSTRRLKENPAIAGHVIRNFLGLSDNHSAG